MHLFTSNRSFVSSLCSFAFFDIVTSRKTLSFIYLCTRIALYLLSHRPSWIYLLRYISLGLLLYLFMAK